MRQLSSAALLFAVLCTACSAERNDDAPRPHQGQATESTTAATPKQQPRNSVNTPEPRHHVDFMSRANLHIQHKRYQEALVDMDAALSLAPHSSEYRFLRCMLKERLGEPLPLAKDCYAQVVNQLAHEDEAKCEADMNCVIADLMAEGPRAHERQQKFLALPASPAESEVRHYVLDKFDRDKYLKTILP